MVLFAKVSVSIIVCVSAFAHFICIVRKFLRLQIETNRKDSINVPAAINNRQSGLDTDIKRSEGFNRLN